ncbi:MAG: hypothetical protein DMF61_12435 [Blastocatellia bacterium AA13]|nr:MAG: hypothetical protein DMF61_12435 [Blastocatellia bacterium AA13]
MEPIGIALLGLGNVARAFIDYIASRVDRPHIEVRAVADSTGGLLLRTPERLTAVMKHKLSSGRLREFDEDASIRDPSHFIEQIRSAGVSTLIELLPTNIEDGQPALDLLRRALLRGLNVVTVDKGPLVHGFESLAEAARASGSRLRFTGTTGVALPEEIKGERMVEIRGVLNGTTNHILSAMLERSMRFEYALAGAQADGIAEPDPSLDVDGWDAACKILILAKTLMSAQTRLAEVSRIGIGSGTEPLIAAARSSGRVVRLVGRARIWQGRIRVSVAPKLIPPESPFFRVNGSSKLAVFRTESGREIISASASSRNSIAEVILQDVLDCIEEQ